MKVAIQFVDRIHTGAINQDGTEWVGGQTPYRKELLPGTSQWMNGIDGQIACLAFVCPCGCGSIGTLSIAHGTPQWAWDGNKELPTLTPSIQKLTPCGWHGYLVEGVWTRC